MVIKADNSTSRSLRGMQRANDLGCGCACDWRALHPGRLGPRSPHIIFTLKQTRRKTGKLSVRVASNLKLVDLIRAAGRKKGVVD